MNIPACEKELLEELFKTASLWEVGDNKEIVRDARERLASCGRTALDYVYRDHLTDFDSLEERAITHLFLNAAGSGDFIEEKLKTETDPARIPVLIYYAGLKTEERYLPFLKRYAGTDQYGYAAVNALAKYGIIENEGEFLKIFKKAPSLKKVCLIVIAAEIGNMNILKKIAASILGTNDPLLFFSFIIACEKLPPEKFMDASGGNEGLISAGAYKYDDPEHVFEQVFREHFRKGSHGRKLRAAIYLYRNGLLNKNEITDKVILESLPAAGG